MSQNQADTEPEAGRVAGRAEGRSVSSSRRQIPKSVLTGKVVSTSV